MDGPGPIPAIVLPPEWASKRLDSSPELTADTLNTTVRTDGCRPNTDLSVTQFTLPIARSPDRHALLQRFTL